VKNTRASTYSKKLLGQNVAALFRSTQSIVKLSGEVESSDFIAIQAETIMASLHGQPTNHPITLEKLLGEESGVPIGLGELFSQTVNQLNNVAVEDASFLSEPSDAKSLTSQSPSSVYAKSSAGHQPNSPSNLPKPSSKSP
jgi:hypothetical protein